MERVGKDRHNRWWMYEEGDTADRKEVRKTTTDREEDTAMMGTNSERHISRG